MARGENQKLKLLYLAEIFLRRTDEEHPITMAELIAELESRGVTAERKSLYDDFEALRACGLDIIKRHGKTIGYYLASRSFELAELKLLVDSVQSSRFITHKKSMELISKLEGLCSVHEAGSLRRQLFVAGRVKTMNESIYYNVDRLHAAIAGNRQAEFYYFEYNVRKERVYRREGKRYRVSPYALVWDNENYYLVAYDGEAEDLRHYRVDKMEKIGLSEEKRLGKERFESFDTARYTKKLFGMFGGRELTVRLRIHNGLAGVVIDRFSRDIIMTPDGPEHFIISVSVEVSSQFYAWVFSLGGDALVLSPPEAVEGMRRQLDAVLGSYERKEAEG